MALPLTAAACAPPDASLDRTAPPAGAVTVAVVYPPPGARWRARHRNRFPARRHGGGPLHRGHPGHPPGGPDTGRHQSGRPRTGAGSGGGRITVLDLASFNVMGTLEGNRVLTVNTPAAGPFSGPLWVGKAWRTLYDHTDFVYGRVWNAAEYHARVAAFEAVTVPAGTFNAFRIEGRGGVGTSVFGNGMGVLSGSSPGVETDETWWYAPDARIAVKTIIQRLGTHYRGVGRTTMELLERPV